MTIIRSINLKCKFFSKNTIREDVNHVKHQNLSSTEMLVMQLAVPGFFGKYSYQFLIEEICQKCIYNNNTKPASELRFKAWCISWSFHQQTQKNKNNKITQHKSESASV